MSASRDLTADRAVDRAPDRAAVLRANHDQIGPALTRDLDDRVRNVSGRGNELGAQLLRC